jgi:hypothetical protein
VDRFLNLELKKEIKIIPKIKENTTVMQKKDWKNWKKGRTEGGRGRKRAIEGEGNGGRTIFNFGKNEKFG